MSLAMAELPTDPDALRAFALACQGELKAAQTAVKHSIAFEAFYELLNSAACRGDDADSYCGLVVSASV